MSNNLLTISQITNEGLMVLENNLTFADKVNREYDSQFAKSGAKIGSVVNARVPPRYTVSTGPQLQVQNSVETYVPITLTTQAQVAMSFSTADLALSIDEFRGRFLEPAIAEIANKIDYDGLQLYKNVYNHVGTIGTAPNAVTFPLACKQRLNEEAAPVDDNRYIVINSATEAAMVGGVSTLFNPQISISENYKKGQMAKASLGFDWYMDQNVAMHTYGTSNTGANPTVNGNQAGLTSPNNDRTASFNLTVNAITGTITAGTVITIANVFAVNPRNRTSTGVLRQFVVTADVAGSATTIPIYPAPIFSGAFQNCYAAAGVISNGATVTLPNTSGQSSNAYAQNIAFHKNAFVLASADLPDPRGVHEVQSFMARGSGLSLRMVRQYDINSDQIPCRIDVLYGWQCVYPELAVRLTA